MIIINEINKAAGTYYETLHVCHLRNLMFHYKLIAGSVDTVELQFWGTTLKDAVEETDDDWVNITNFLTGEDVILINNGTINDLSIIDTNCTFRRIKIKYIVITSSPNNNIKVGWNGDK